MNGKTCSLDISKLNPDIHLGDWKCEIWNGIKKVAGGMAEEEATVRVVELGVRYRGPMSNVEDQTVEVESGKCTYFTKIEVL